ncbi:NUDIX domain-containing protein [Shewanella schlegeliana]|uniref:NUDIX domain-containing protein n=1 Tax=Shewanella schlegeliana TaxID=190308 RepID=A0ABS1T228_9GAMM|nr:NUDIX domain-containing protein [Shewanella schlegeliana]MBL4914850.1 NUDIX domain-containing protein [Shewanella schlegeliana]MCL1110459.1 NUDIX domain-containing protein [Shewanella schlegeliana]GIU27572.1 NUDIX hydrolase [Shewanella schlegeliana]
MAFDDKFRLSSHAVILKPDSSEPSVLLLKASYGDCCWGLPGGALEPRETIHEALMRECQEELGVAVEVKYLSGVYYHQVYDSQAFIFRCELSDLGNISLSDEHSEYRFTPLSELSNVQKQRVIDCLDYNGAVVSRKF